MSEDPREEIRERKRKQLLENSRAAEEPTENEPVHIASESELGEITERDAVVLVDFYADWCGPCKMLEPVVADLAAETDTTVAKVDVDTNQQLASQYGVQGVPTLLLFVDGEPVERLVGVQDKDTLTATIAQYS
jgi:thioredoxin 1